MRRSIPYFLAVALTALAVVGGVHAAEDTAKEHAELAKALTAAKVPLGTGLSGAATAGKPISAKFEVEDGKLQMSVYTEKDGKFSEVVVNHVTGKVAKSEPITEGEDLAHAQSQAEAMAKARLSLSNAVSKAVSANPGFHAVSVYPSLKDGHPVAEVSLHKGPEWRTVTEKLE
jgi:uncharacterized membrane protein YkoI